jgi:hypothetical protein
MHLSKISTSLAGILLFALSTPALPSGGDGFSVNAFANEYQPAASVLNAYAAGNLGVVPGSYWRVNLYLAFQAAKGKPLTEQQVKALALDGWHVGSGIAWDYSYEPDKNGSGSWIKERAAYAKLWKLPADLKLDVMAEQGDNANYVNCPADAFNQASATLKARALLGAGNKPDVWHKVWLQGQDAVFANCAEPAHEYGKPVPKRSVTLPAALAANAPQWLQFDHAYQTAAANFYARNFDLARAQFQTIAHEAKSPWHTIGAYVAARSLIRKALLEFPLQDRQAAAPERIASLLQAKKELEAMAPSYAPARQLISLVEARIDPAQRIATLALRLENEAFGADTPRMLSDYLILLDAQEGNAMIDAKEPMTAWIGAMQAGSPPDPYGGQPSKELEQQRKAALQTLRQRWLKQADPLWLAPLLALAHAKELSAAERKAAAAIASAHPLYQHAQYHLARLAILENRVDQADKDIDRVMATFGKTMSVATTNRFLALKMVSANSLDDYLKAALRRPDQVDTGTPIDAAAPAADTDADFVRSVFQYLPLNELKTLLKRPSLPVAFKTRLQETAFARALIFNDEATALEYLDIIAATRATTRQLYTRYRNAKPGQERKLAASLILVNTPELGPAVFDTAGVAREWGCKTFGTPDIDTSNVVAAAPRFLSVQEHADADREQQTLLKLPLRSEFIAPTLLAWARTKPNDEEAPKALHFLVASTRMECPYGGDKPEKEQARARYSREAFDLLHKLYPNSQWTKQTKYYF